MRLRLRKKLKKNLKNNKLKIQNSKLEIKYIYGT